MNIKRILGLVLSIAILVCAVCMPTSAASMPDLLIGDADADGEISVLDATAICMHLARLKELDELSVQVAKCEFTTEELSVLDATLIQMAVASIDTDATREVGQTAFIYSGGEYKPALQVYQELLDRLMTKVEISGVAYATRNGRVMCQGAYGMQNAEENIEMSMDTLFPIGSVSKQFCATAVLMLQDEGKLSVNDTIDKYFPDYKYGSQITVHQLLCMRSGIPDYLNDNPTAYELFIFDDYQHNLKSVFDWICSQDLLFEPDTKYWYSNSNYRLLALIVEQVSGKKYEEFVQEKIFDRLSMTNTGFLDDLIFDDRMAKWVVHEDYYTENDVLWIGSLGSAKGGGDIVTNAEDIDKWLTAMADGTLLSEESYKQMTTNYSGFSYYGYGIDVNEKKKIYKHSGRILTYVTSTVTYANKNINVFVVTNDDWTAMCEGFDPEEVSAILADKISS